MIDAVPCMEKGALTTAAPRLNVDNPIKILNYLFFPSAGSGVGRYTHEIVRRIAAVPDLAPELVCTPSCHWASSSEYPSWRGLREISHESKWRRRFRFLTGQVVNPHRLLARAAEMQADIIHFSNINQLTFPIWKYPLKRSNAKIVATVHDAFRQRGLVHPLYDNRQLAEFYRAADALFVHGEDQLSSLVERAGVERDRICLVPHGPYDYGAPPAESRQTIRAKHGLRSDCQLALFFGNVRDDKNLELFLRALAESGEPLQVLIAGRVSRTSQINTAEYMTLIDRLGLGSRVRLLDRFVADSEIPELFSAADWVALPYSRTFTSQSGVLAIAASYGRPVLVSNTGALGSAVAEDDIGVCVEPDSLSDLVRGIRLISERLRQSAAFQFDSFLCRNSWEQNVLKTANVYRRLAGTQRSEGE